MSTAESTPPINLGEAYKVLNDYLSIVYKNGHIALQPGVTAALYIENAYRLAVREAVVVACELYTSRAAQHLRWALNPDTDDMEPFGTGKGTSVRDWLPLLEERSEYELIMHGASDEQSASAWSLEALGIARRSYDTVSFLRISFPLSFIAESRALFCELLLEMCRVLRPISGYAGIGVNASLEACTRSRHAIDICRWVQRFPGLELDSTGDTIALSEGRNGGPGIRGASWLTVLADRWVDELGGFEKVSADIAAMDDRFSIRPYDGGLLIRAGDYPRLGDTQRDIWPELHVKLARYLKPIRVTEHSAFHSDDPRTMDRQASESWLRRFDDR